VREESELVRVHTAQGWHLAQIYKSKLEAAEIPVLLKYEALGLVYGLTVDGLGAVDVLVPAAYADDARAMLEDIEETETEDWDEVEPGEDEAGEVAEPDPEDL
jgi:hypothetical protein